MLVRRYTWSFSYVVVVLLIKIEGIAREITDTKGGNKIVGEA
jgi:hypothetical protein